MHCTKLLVDVLYIDRTALTGDIHSVHSQTIVPKRISLLEALVIAHNKLTVYIDMIVNIYIHAGNFKMSSDRFANYCLYENDVHMKYALISC